MERQEERPYVPDRWTAGQYRYDTHSCSSLSRLLLEPVPSPLERPTTPHSRQSQTNTTLFSDKHNRLHRLNISSSNKPSVKTFAIVVVSRRTRPLSLCHTLSLSFPFPSSLSLSLFVSPVSPLSLLSLCLSSPPLPPRSV